jgi:hypothetical protein
MHILFSGASGLVGSALSPALVASGHALRRLTRSAAAAGASAVEWDPQAGRLDAAALEGIDAAVHLAGENIAAGRWTAAKKRRIRDSRVLGTRLLSETLARLSRPPRALIVASAVGFYGHRGEEVLTEDSPPGAGFLAETCCAWEAAADPARQRGVRVVHLRLGVVLSKHGGALAKMLPLFRIGLGGVIGDGRQYVSWIAIPDVVGVVQHALETESLSGPINVVAPEPVTNRELTLALGRVLGRPTLAPVPAVVARLVLGEMADAALLASTRVLPARLRACGYPFQFSRLEPALRHLLRV